MKAIVQNMGKSAKRIISALLVLIILVVSLLTGHIISGLEKETLHFGVMSDTHYYPPEYADRSSQVYQDYLAGDPKMLYESSFVFDAALNLAKKQGTGVLIIPGDLTKDGERLGFEQMAEKLRAYKDETGSQVFVIPGNHDIYNYDHAVSFANGQKSQVPTVTPAEFREIFADFGYNQAIATYEPPAGTQYGGLSYVADIDENYRIIAFDTNLYSTDVNGLDRNQQLTGGMINDHLLAWGVEQIRQATAEGKTMIGMGHHSLIPHFSLQPELADEYIIPNWQHVAGQLADAGLRYYFTGHMHANDIATYTSPAGNTIIDAETAALVSYGSFVREVTIERGRNLQDGSRNRFETITFDGEFITEVQLGDGTIIPDYREYAVQTLYGRDLLPGMAWSYGVAPLLAEVNNNPEGLLGYIQSKMPDFNLEESLDALLTEHLSATTNINLGTAGRATAKYADQVITITVGGIAGHLTSGQNVTLEQVVNEIAGSDGLIKQVENLYLRDTSPDGRLRKIVDDLVNGLTSITLTADGHDLYDLVIELLLGHYNGDENHEAWVFEAIDNLRSGQTIKDIQKYIVPELKDLIGQLSNELYFHPNRLFTGTFLTAVNSATNNGQLSKILEVAWVDIDTLIDQAINKYLTDSFYTGLGGTLATYAESFAYDYTPDGTRAVWSKEFNGLPNPVIPSVSNGLLASEISMTPGANIYTDRNFLWYTGRDTQDSYLQIAEDNGYEPDFTRDTKTFQARGQEVVTPHTGINLHLYSSIKTKIRHRFDVQITGLTAGKSYWYRVGNNSLGGAWSDPVKFTMPSEGSSNLLVFSDPQGQIPSDYEVFGQAVQVARNMYPNVGLALNLGDIVDVGQDENQWRYHFEPASVRGLAWIPVTGNHENSGTVKEDAHLVDTLDPIHRHFDLSAFTDSKTDTNYALDYGQARIVVINTELFSGPGSGAEAIDFARTEFSNTDKPWKILAMHKSAYSNGPHGMDEDVLAMRPMIENLVAESDVDLVLSGHEHVYSRSHVLNHGLRENTATEVKNYQGQNFETYMQPKGTVFVSVGTTGVKRYNLTYNVDLPLAKEFAQTGPTFSQISMTDEELFYNTYMIDDGSARLVDSFAISKNPASVADIFEQDKFAPVIEQISALPSIASLSVEARINSARRAYEALSPEDKTKVNNYDKLERLERELAALKQGPSGQTRVVTNKDEFLNALRDNNVSKIEVRGTIEIEGMSWFSPVDTIQNVNRDLTIGGTGTLTYLGLRVQENKTLTLADSLTIDAARKWGSVYFAITPVELQNNANLIIKDNASLKTEYGTGKSYGIQAENGNNKVLIDTRGSIFASDEVIMAGPNSTVIINNVGKLENKNNYYAIKSSGQVEINGGHTADIEIYQNGALALNGGTVDPALAGNKKIPVNLTNSATAVLGNARIVDHNGTAFQLGNYTKLDIQGHAENYITQPYAYGEDKVAAYYKTWVTKHSPDSGFYDLGQAAESLDKIKANEARATKLETTITEDKLEGTLPAGKSHVYAKIYVNGKGAGSSDLIKAEPNTEVAIYSSTVPFENVVIENLRLIGEDQILFARPGFSRQLKYETTPNVAFRRNVLWESSDQEVASVNQDGLLEVQKPGFSTITAKTEFDPNIASSLEVLAIDPAISGPDHFHDVGELGQYTIDYSLENNKLGVRWSSSNPLVAEIDEYTGDLQVKAPGQFRVIAHVTYDGQDTGIVETHPVTVTTAIEINAYLNHDLGQSYVSASKINESIRIIATGQKDIEYKKTDLATEAATESDWLAYTEPIRELVEKEETSHVEYTFRYVGETDTEAEKSFTVDISKVTPKLAELEALSTDEKWQSRELPTIPEEYKASLSGVAITADTKLNSTTDRAPYELELEDVYGNKNLYELHVELEADRFTLEVTPLEVKEGAELTVEDYKERISNLPSDAQVAILQDVDTSLVENQTAKLQITFQDDSTLEVDITVQVLALTQAEQTELEVTPLEVKEGAELTVEDYKERISNLPSDAQVAILQDVDTSLVENQTAKLQITFQDDSTLEVDITVQVLALTQAEQTELEVTPLEVKEGAELTVEDYKERISNLPSDAQVRIQTAAPVDKLGQHLTEVEVTFSDSSTKVVTIPVQVQEAITLELLFIKEDEYVLFDPTREITPDLLTVEFINKDTNEKTTLAKEDFVSIKSLDPESTEDYLAVHVILDPGIYTINVEGDLVTGLEDRSYVIGNMEAQELTIELNLTRSENGKRIEVMELKFKSKVQETTTESGTSAETTTSPSESTTASTTGASEATTSPSESTAASTTGASKATTSPSESTTTEPTSAPTSPEEAATTSGSLVTTPSATPTETRPSLIPTSDMPEVQVIKGARAKDEQVYELVPNSDLVLRYEEDYTLFVMVLVNGQELDSVHYTVQEGSTIVTIKASYLESLPAGRDHRIEAVFRSGKKIGITLDNVNQAAIESTATTTSPSTEVTSKTGSTTSKSDRSSTGIGKTGENIHYLVLGLLLITSSSILVFKRRKLEEEEE